MVALTTQEKIINLLKKSRQKLSAADISKKVNLKSAKVASRILAYLHEEGIVEYEIINSGTRRKQKLWRYANPKTS
jgi:predicted ArsR family transcriptional regulator